MPVPHDGPSITLQQCLELFMIDRRDLVSRRTYLVCSTQPQHVAALRPAVRVSWLILTPPICCPGLATGAIVRVSSAGAHDVGRHFLGPDLDVPSPEIAQSHHPPIKSLLSIYINIHSSHGDDAASVNTARRALGLVLCRRHVWRTYQ